jgi:NADPH:quinone reductase-like Zn-dependent oxidoreductase
VNVGSIEKGNWIGPLIKPIQTIFINPITDPEIVGFVATMTQEDIEILAKMMKEGKLTPVLDKSYPLAETADAVAYSETGRARGKIIVTVK